jgi:pilus assembly protein CpaF
MEGEMITLQNLFEFKVDRVDADRKVVGRLEPTGLRPLFLGKFHRHGIELPLDLFGTPATAMYGSGGHAGDQVWAGERR